MSEGICLQTEMEGKDKTDWNAFPFKVLMVDGVPGGKGMPSEIVLLSQDGASGRYLLEELRKPVRDMPRQTSQNCSKMAARIISAIKQAASNPKAYTEFFEEDWLEVELEWQEALGGIVNEAL